MWIDCNMGSSKFLSWSIFKTHIDQGFLLEPVYKIIITLANFFLLLLGFLVKLIIRFLVDQNDLDLGGFFEFQLHEQKQEQEVVFMEISGILEKPENMDFTVKEIFENSDDFDVITVSCKEVQFPSSRGNETNEQDLIPMFDQDNDLDLMGIEDINRGKTEEKDCFSGNEELGQTDQEISMEGLLDDEEEETCGQDQNPFQKWEFEVKDDVFEEEDQNPIQKLEFEVENDVFEEEEDQNPIQKWGFEVENDVFEEEYQNPFQKWKFEVENDVFEEEDQNPIQKLEFEVENDVLEEEDQNPIQKLEFEVENDVFEEEDQSPIQKLEFEVENDVFEEQDVLMEHKELIEQMKMEAKNARNGGLPTIMEDLEIPLKFANDFKPLKFDKEKLQYKDHMEEIQKVYKSYSEKMKKLDIFNYQTVQAISFLRMKDPPPAISSSTAFTIKSLISPSRWPFKLQRIYSDLTVKSMTNLHRDLETVYVGQTCLSWEILKWQYEKANTELLNTDIDSQKTYNRSAHEFQQFQAILQRFLEKEPFQGPRIQNYARHSSSIRAILHVPVIKEDCLNEKMKQSSGECTRICIGMLINIMEETMRVFWEFVRADKESSIHDQKGVDDLVEELRKKKRKLRDIVRSRKCIVKKFQKQKHLQGRLVDCNQLSAQVELKMVARVLSMSKGLTIDQLAWCQKKLNKVSFINGKIHLESTFLLFPA